MHKTICPVCGSESSLPSPEDAFGRTTSHAVSKKRRLDCGHFAPVTGEERDRLILDLFNRVSKIENLSQEVA